MRKQLIGSGIPGLSAVAVLVGSLATAVLAQGSSLPAASPASITPEEATAAAEAAHPGTAAIELELEAVHGVQAYEVELDKGLEVQVDASNGTILGTEQDDSDQVGDTGGAG